MIRTPAFIRRPTATFEALRTSLAPSPHSSGTLRALRRRRARAALVGGLAGSLLAASPLLAQRSPDFAELDRYVAKAARDWHVPGLAIAVVKDDSVVFAKGYGVIEIGKPARVNEHTRFAIGSTTKAMTVAALGMLVDEGKLTWDERVIDIIPDFRLYDPYVTREVTVRDLLTHRTGVPGTDLFWVIPENHYTLPEIIHRLRYIKPASSFRSQWEYENVMYAIAGDVVARVSGMSWENFVRTRIFAPLGMNESIPLVSELAGQPNVAVPHGEIGDSVRVVPGLSTDVIAPAGSIWSSVSDMSKWMRFMLDSGRVGNTRLLRPATFDEIVAPQIQAPMEEYPALELAKPHFFSYAFAWFVQDYQGQVVWMHTGSINGMCAIIGLMPQQKLGVYVLENLDHAELRHALMYRVFDMYNAGQNSARARTTPRDWSADLKAFFDSAAKARGAGRRAAAATPPGAAGPALPLERYVGTYVDSAYGAINVTLTGGALHARFVNLDLGQLEHVDYDTFRGRRADRPGASTPVSFTQNGMGHLEAVRAFGVTFQRAKTTSGAANGG
jgi:CubicO group peptidase (beta-lactamase class C family)